MAFYREDDQFEISPKELSGHQYLLVSVAPHLLQKLRHVEILKQSGFISFMMSSTAIVLGVCG